MTKILIALLLALPSIASAQLGGGFGFGGFETNLLESQNIWTASQTFNGGITSNGDIDATGFRVNATSFNAVGSAYLVNDVVVIDGAGTVVAPSGPDTIDTAAIQDNAVTATKLDETESYQMAGLNVVGGNVGIGEASPSARLEIKQQEEDENVVLVSSNSGTSMFVVKKDGKVGIGVANPAFGLDVDSGDLNLGGGNAYLINNQQLLDLNNSTHIRLGTNGTITMIELSNAHLFVNENREIGIGIDPQDNDIAKLHILTISSNTIRVESDDDVDVIFYSASAGANESSTIMLKRAEGSQASPTLLGADSKIGALEFIGAHTTAEPDSSLKNAWIEARTEGAQSSTNISGNLIFATREDGLGSLGTAVEKMRLSHDGNLGIGTNAPSHPLHILGNGVNGVQTVRFANDDAFKVVLDCAATAQREGELIFKRSRGTLASRVEMAGNSDVGIIKWQAGYSTGDPNRFGAAIRGTTGPTLQSVDNNSGNILFLTRKDALGVGGNATEKMRLTHDGLLGIGTSVPCSTCTLHVVGNFSANGGIEAGDGVIFKAKTRVQLKALASPLGSTFRCTDCNNGVNHVVSTTTPGGYQPFGIDDIVW